MAKGEVSYEDRLRQAALEGVLLRLNGHQPGYVVRFMENCTAPELIYQSKQVKSLALDILRSGFDHLYVSRLLGGNQLKTAIDLLKAVKVPDGEITWEIMLYFQEYYDKHWERLPRDFQYILEEYPIPVEVLNKNKKFQEAALREIRDGIHGDEECLRQRCFLKYFLIPEKELTDLVYGVIMDLPFQADDDPKAVNFVDLFVSEAGLNKGKMLEVLTKSIRHLIGDGFMKEAEYLVSKYKVDPRIFLSEENKAKAIEAVLDKFRHYDPKQYEEAKQMMKVFGLERINFEEKGLKEVIADRLRRGHDIAVTMDLISFADLPRETMIQLIRGNLDSLVYLDTEKLQPFVEQYGIGWDEVVEAAKKHFVGSLSSSGVCPKNFIKKFDLSPEFLKSEEVINAAKEGVLVLYRLADHNNNIGFLKETFGVS